MKIRPNIILHFGKQPSNNRWRHGELEGYRFGKRLKDTITQK
jgi:hypothetical protein